MKKAVRVKAKRKDPITTRAAVEQLYAATAFAHDGAPSSAIRCAKSAVSILEKLAKHQQKLLTKLAGK